MPNGYPPGFSGHMRLIEQQPGGVAHTTPGEVTQGKRRLASQIGLPFTRSRIT